MSSIFDLKTDVAELSSSNQGTAKMSYEQYPPTRDVTTTNFSNGAIHIRWQVSGQKWWLPNRSYLRVRCQLSKPDGTQLKLADNIAPNMGLCASLFQSAEFRINDKTVSRVSDFMPQVDALETRLTKSRSWLNGLGHATNLWNEEFKVRQCDVALDGPNQDVSYNTTARVALGYDAAANTVAIAADTGILTFAVGGGAALPAIITVWATGDEIEIDTGDAAVGTVRYYVSAAITGTQTLQLNNYQTVAFAAAAVPFRRIRKSLVNNDCRNVSQFELTWVPPLSIFKVGHALPSGRYELILNPQTSNVYQISAVETLNTDVVKLPAAAGNAANTYKFEVQSLYMYLNTVEGPRADDITYLLDLEQTRCQSDQVGTQNLTQKNWDVSPSTYALTVAYQDGRAGTDTRISSSKFKCYNGFGAPPLNAPPATEQELKLTRFFINYAGVNAPAPDADPSFTPTTDYTTQRYVESQMYSGAYYDAGGGESLKEFHTRGSYYYFSWPRDGTDRSTRVTVNQQFDAAADVSTMRVLLFDHSKQVARVRVQDGRVVDVQLEDA